MEDTCRPQPDSNHYHDIKHSMLRRMDGHDYKSRCIYMVTLCTEGRKPVLGTLRCSEDHLDDAYVEPTELGIEVQRCWESIPLYHPEVEVMAFQLMPDHIHGILFVHSMQEAHLGQIINGFKVGCNRAVRLIEAMPRCTQPSKHPTQGLLFAPGYQDSILMGKNQLDHMFRYLADNPRRLAIKRQNPQLFTVMNQMEIVGRRCQCIGNRFLLDVLDKVAVIYHRRYSEEELSRLREEWLGCGERGGVLVSAAIHSIERAVIRVAKERGYRVIDLMENGFPPLYKPIGEDFDACAEGRLLQISPWDYHMERKVITRAQCLELNAMAEAIAQ